MSPFFHRGWNVILMKVKASQTKGYKMQTLQIHQKYVFLMKLILNELHFTKIVDLYFFLENIFYKAKHNIYKANYCLFRRQFEEIIQVLNDDRNNLTNQNCIYYF